MTIINGIKWNIVFVDSYSSFLMRSDGVLTLGVTDNTTKCIYLSNALHGRLLEKVLTHELVHCYCFSYHVFVDIETEEILADFVANYGTEILNDVGRAIIDVSGKYVIL